MTHYLRLELCCTFGKFFRCGIQHKNFEVSKCAAWAVRVTEIFLYIKAYSFGGNKENFELGGVSS